MRHVYVELVRSLVIMQFTTLSLHLYLMDGVSLFSVSSGHFNLLEDTRVMPADEVGFPALEDDLGGSVA